MQILQDKFFKTMKDKDFEMDVNCYANIQCWLKIFATVSNFYHVALTVQKLHYLDNLKRRRNDLQSGAVWSL